jgi:hypothetical protein
MPQSLRVMNLRFPAKNAGVPAGWFWSSAYTSPSHWPWLMSSG